MATTASTIAVIRAYRPSFKTEHAKVAFAVHSALCAAGCRLLAVGAEGESQDPAVRFRAEEATITGWDEYASPLNGGHFTFMYAPPAGTAACASGVQATGQVLLMKAVALGEQLLVNLVLDPCPEGQAPDTLTLQVERYSGAPEASAPVPPYTYSNMEELVQLVMGALANQVKGLQGAGTTPAADAAVASTAGRGRPEARRDEDEEVDPLRDYTQPGYGAPGGFRPPYQPDPMSVGRGDLMPGGVPMPGRHPEQGPLGGAGPGGGMHVGPGHPVFGGGGMFPDTGAPRPGFGGQGQGGPGPGMRWDPIAPPGLPGYRPGDFAPGGPGRGGRGGIHPDVMQPGAGRGTDWDNMFG